MSRVLLLSLLISLSGVVSAQTFQASVLAGVNASQIDGDQLFGFHQPGVNAGIRVVAVLDERWRVGPEILFSQQGARRNKNISSFSRFRLNTLEVPLMVYYKDWRLTAEAGFSYQRLFSYEVDDGLGQDITAVTDLQDNLFAFNAGITFHVSENFGLNFRWSKHIANIDVDNQLNNSFKGRTISLRAVYTFGEGEALPKPIDPEE
ncbi:MAG: outer membrane beta-barrel protein [Bacteroidota bacterium]